MRVLILEADKGIHAKTRGEKMKLCPDRPGACTADMAVPAPLPRPCTMSLALVVWTADAGRPQQVAGLRVGRQGCLAMAKGHGGGETGSNPSAIWRCSSTITMRIDERPDGEISKTAPKQAPDGYIANEKRPGAER